MTEDELVTIDPALGATERSILFEGRRTWTAVVGDEAVERRLGLAPLLVLHGGPGACHDYLEALAEVAATGRRVIFYDQQGCGNSDPIGEPTRCTVDLYVREVDAVRDAYALDRLHILGQSWGGMLLMEYLVRQPAGLVSAIIASSPASMPLWAEETGRQRAALPAAVVEVMERHEADATWDDPAYIAAVDVFNHRHLCRVVPFPEAVARSFEKLARDPTVYRTMNGPNEFHVVGTLKAWDITDRLSSIDGPVLLTSGRHDEATPVQVARIAERIPQAEWVIFEESGHLAHAEEPARYLAVLADFLARAEAGLTATRATTDGRDRHLPRSAGAGTLTGLPGPA
jgi:proline-specific peptidase